jgi:hypothetical protein
VLHRAEREEARALRGGADDVVVGQGSSIVPVRARVDIACSIPAADGECGLRPRSRNGSRDPHQLRLGERAAREARRLGVDREPPVDLLVLDVLGSARAYALQHEVEAVLLVLADPVVVHGRAQELTRARGDGRELERFA